MPRTFDSPIGKVAITRLGVGHLRVSTAPTGAYDGVAIGFANSFHAVGDGSWRLGNVNEHNALVAPYVVTFDWRGRDEPAPAEVARRAVEAVAWFLALWDRHHPAVSPD